MPGETATASLTLVVRRAELLSPRIRLVELAAEDGAELPPFTAGAHIDIDIGPEDGRSYSLLNDPTERHRYVIAVLREQPGRGGSAWVHDVVQVGHRITATAPTNHFALNQAAEQILLIAGGIGITPMLSMVEQLLAEGRPFHLYYCARSAEEAPFAAALEARIGDRLTLTLDGGDPARGLDLTALLKQKPPGGHAYVCGPRGMIQAVREATQHWPKGTVHWELFAGSEEDTAPRSNDLPFEVELAKSGKSFTVPADRKLLDVLRAEGFRIKTLCKEGVCGTCRVRVLSGEVDHRDEVLTVAEQKKFMQVCVSRAKPGERLVLDL